MFCDSALSSSITAKRSKTTAQVNIALSKFETTLQVSILTCLGFMGWRCQKAAYLIFGLILKPVCFHVTISVCLHVTISVCLHVTISVCLHVMLNVRLSHCTSLLACLSASLLYICLSVLCLSVCLPGSSCLSLNLSVCDCLSVFFLSR